MDNNIEAFYQELRNTSVISQEFKDRLIILFNKALESTFDRGIQAGRDSGSN